MGWNLASGTADADFAGQSAAIFLWLHRQWIKQCGAGAGAATHGFDDRRTVDQSRHCHCADAAEYSPNATSGCGKINRWLWARIFGDRRLGGFYQQSHRWFCNGYAGDRGAASLAAAESATQPTTQQPQASLSASHRWLGNGANIVNADCTYSQSDYRLLRIR